MAKVNAEVFCIILNNNLGGVNREGAKKKSDITGVNIKGWKNNSFGKVKKEARGIFEQVKSDKHMPKPPKKVVEVESDIVGEGA